MKMEYAAINRLKDFMVTSFNQIVDQLNLDSEDVRIREVINLKLVREMEKHEICFYEYGKTVVSYNLLASIDLQLIADVTAALLTSGVNAANLITDRGIRLEVGTSSQIESEFIFAAISQDKTLIVSKFVRNKSKSTRIFLMGHTKDINSATIHAISPRNVETTNINIKEQVIRLIEEIIAKPNNTRKGESITWLQL